MQDDSIFRIYSMTKPLVSLLALMLAEEGRLQLGEPVSRYLPEFAGQQVAIEEGGKVRLQPARRDATVHDLLRHTAGLTYEFLGDSAVQRQYSAADIANRSRINANRSAGGTLPAACHAKPVMDWAGGRRAKCTASHPFSQRMTAVAVQMAKKTTALAPIVVQKTCR